MRSVVLASQGREPTSNVRIGDPLEVRVTFARDKRLDPVLGVVVKGRQGLPLLDFNNRFIGGFKFEAARAGTITCRIDAIPLMPGQYLIDLWLDDGGQPVDVVYDAISFEVLQADVFGTGRLPNLAIVAFQASFTFTDSDAASTEQLDSEASTALISRRDF